MWEGERPVEAGPAPPANIMPAGILPFTKDDSSPMGGFQASTEVGGASWGSAAWSLWCVVC